MISYCNFKTN